MFFFLLNLQYFFCNLTFFTILMENEIVKLLKKVKLSYLSN